MTHHAGGSDPQRHTESGAETISASTDNDQTARKGFVFQAPALVFAGVISAIVAALLTYYVPRWLDPANKPPEVHIKSTSWVAPPADQKTPVERYSVTGTATNLAAGQVLWTFNQSVNSSDQEGLIYADPGPCGPNEQGDFTCALGAADAPAVNGVAVKDYNIIVAVVTTEQAYAFAQQKAGFIAQVGYPAIPAIPHVQGANTTDVKRVIKP